MIIKNCYIYDSLAGKEVLSDFYLSDKIVEYGINLTDKINAEDKIVTDIFSLTPELIEKINSGFSDVVIDAKGLITLPGGIDAHVHFDTPGFTEREDFYHGSMSAAAGGITTVIDMPCTSLPPVTNGENFDIKYDAVKDTSVIDYAFFGGINSRRFDDYIKCMDELAEKKVKGFKTYFVSGMETFPRVTKYEFSHILEHALILNIPVLLHAEDFGVISSRAKDLASEDDNYLKYCLMRPEAAEIEAVKEAVFIAKHVNDNLHVVHVGSARAAAIINSLEDKGRITYETCPHYLAFTQDDFKIKGSLLKTAPVVKSEYDKENLWKYLLNGSCSFVASDHAPCSLAEKNTGSFMTDYGGIPGTQTMLPYLFSEGYVNRKMPLSKLYQVVSESPAKRYGLYPAKGSLNVNTDADMTFINPSSKYTFSKDDLLSKGETTPFDGENFTGKVVLTIVRGKIVYYENLGITINKGFGKYI